MRAKLISGDEYDFFSRRVRGKIVRFQRGESHRLKRSFWKRQRVAARAWHKKKHQDNLFSSR